MVVNRHPLVDRVFPRNIYKVSPKNFHLNFYPNCSLAIPLILQFFSCKKAIFIFALTQYDLSCVKMTLLSPNLFSVNGIKKVILHFPGHISSDCRDNDYYHQHYFENSFFGETICIPTYINDFENIRGTFNKFPDLFV